MSQRYPLQTLLRPPVELSSTITLCSIATMLVLAPRWFLLLPELAAAVAALLVLRGAQRAHQAWRIIRYHWRLRQLPLWTVRTDRVPTRAKRQWLGRGFEWSARHTQRLAEARRAGNEHYLRHPWLVRAVRRFEESFEETPLLRHLAALTATQSRWNPLAPPPPVGGDPTIHGVGMYESGAERDIWNSLADRKGHTLVIGTTRAFKTVLARLLIAQDIKRGDTVIVLDPKGDPELLVEMYRAAVEAGRDDTFYAFHLGHPHISARYNPIGDYTRITEVASRVASKLPGEGQSAAFREFSWRQLNVIARAHEALGKPISYESLLESATNIDPIFRQYLEMRLTAQVPDWRQQFAAIDKETAKEGFAPHLQKGRETYDLALVRLAREHQAAGPVGEALIKIWEYDRSFYERLVASLYPLLEKLTTGPAGELLSPDYDNLDDPRPIFSWRDVIRMGGVVYVGLDALTDPEVASVVGASMFNDLTSAAGEIYNEGAEHGLASLERDVKPIRLYGDEWNELMGTESIPMLNKAAGAGMDLTALTQTPFDVEAKLGDKARANQVLANFNTLLVGRVRDEQAAKVLVDKLPEVEVPREMVVSTAGDDPQLASQFAFRGQAQHRLTVETQPMLTAYDLLSMPRGQAMALLADGKLYKLRFPMPARPSDRLPETLGELTERMRETYQSTEDWWHYVPSWDDPDARGTRAGAPHAVADPSHA